MLQYHIISCARTSFKGDAANFTTLLGPQITVEIKVLLPSINKRKLDINFLYISFLKKQGISVLLKTATVWHEIFFRELFFSSFAGFLIIRENKSPTKINSSEKKIRENL